MRKPITPTTYSTGVTKQSVAPMNHEPGAVSGEEKNIDAEAFETEAQSYRDYVAKKSLLADTATDVPAGGSDSDHDQDARPADALSDVGAGDRKPVPWAFDKVGLLTKLGGNVKNWLERGFALQSTAQLLHYFRSARDFKLYSQDSTGNASKVAGTIPLNGASMFLAFYAEFDNCLEITTTPDRRHYYVYAKTRKEIQHWIYKLSEAGVRYVSPISNAEELKYISSRAPHPVYGMQEKRGHWNTAFKKRFFRLQEDPDGKLQLSYYTRYDDTKPKGSIPLEDSEIQPNVESAKPPESPENQFAIQTTQRVFILRSSTVREKEIWLEVLMMAVRDVTAVAKRLSWVHPKRRVEESQTEGGDMSDEQPGAPREAPHAGEPPSDIDLTLVATTHQQDPQVVSGASIPAVLVKPDAPKAATPAPEPMAAIGSDSPGPDSPSPQSVGQEEPQSEDTVYQSLLVEAKQAGGVQLSDAQTRAVAADKLARQKSREHSQHDQSDHKRQEQRYKTLMEEGTIMIKCGRRGAPHERQIFLVGNRLFWSPVGAKTSAQKPAAKRSIDMHTATAVVVGKKTDVFSKKNTAALSEDRCFSVLCTDRTLDLVANTSDHRDEWVAAFRFLITKFGSASAPQ